VHEGAGGAGPANQEHKNVEAVIGARVIVGSTGPPHILATYFR
jgi:hypothetical protein